MRASLIEGVYEIVRMERWGMDAADREKSGSISIQGKRGRLFLIDIDGQMEIKKDRDRYLFTWVGTNGCDPASGYGNFTSDGDTLTGRIYIHDSHDSSFFAIKKAPVKKLARMVNRGLLVVKAKEPFREWIESLKDDNIMTIRDINHDSTAYLIPSFKDDQGRDEILNKVYPGIFAEQLLDRCIDDVRWPQNRTLQLFNRWFELEFHSVVEDMVESD